MKLPASVIREIRALGDRGDAAGLAEIIPDPGAASSRKLRHAVLTQLGRIGDQECIPALAQLAADPEDFTIRFEAVKQLSRFRGSAAARDVLHKSLTDPDSRVRGVAAQGLADLGTDASLPALVSALEDPAAIVRDRACLALGAIGSPAAVPAVAPLLSDEQRTVRLGAADALARIGGAGAAKALEGAAAHARFPRRNVLMRQAEEARGRTHAE